MFFRANYLFGRQINGSLKQKGIRNNGHLSQQIIKNIFLE